MSLWNAYSFDPKGQPVTGRAPDALRVLGGQATAAQLTMAQSAFTSYCMRARLAVVPNPTELGRLPDGTPYRIVTVGNATVMEIQPGGEDVEDKSIRGILATHTAGEVSRAWLIIPGGKFRAPDNTWKIKLLPEIPASGQRYWYPSAGNKGFVSEFAAHARGGKTLLLGGNLGPAFTYIGGGRRFTCTPAFNCEERLDTQAESDGEPKTFTQPPIFSYLPAPPGHGGGLDENICVHPTGNRFIRPLTTGYLRRFVQIGMNLTIMRVTRAFNSAPRQVMLWYETYVFTGPAASSVPGTLPTVSAAEDPVPELQLNCVPPDAVTLTADGVFDMTKHRACRFVQTSDYNIDAPVPPPTPGGAIGTESGYWAWTAQQQRNVNWEGLVLVTKLNDLGQVTHDTEKYIEEHSARQEHRTDTHRTYSWGLAPTWSRGDMQTADETRASTITRRDRRVLTRVIDGMELVVQDSLIDEVATQETHFEYTRLPYAESFTWERTQNASISVTLRHPIFMSSLLRAKIYLEYTLQWTKSVAYESSDMDTPFPPAVPSVTHHLIGESRGTEVLRIPFESARPPIIDVLHNNLNEPGVSPAEGSVWLDTSPPGLPNLGDYNYAMDLDYSPFDSGIGVGVPSQTNEIGGTDAVRFTVDGEITSSVAKDPRTAAAVVTVLIGSAQRLHYVVDMRGIRPLSEQFPDLDPSHPEWFVEKVV